MDARLKRPPIPRQEFVKLIDRVLGDAGEHVGQPGLRIDIVQFGGDDQAVDRRGALSAAIGTGEQPRFSAEGDAASIMPLFFKPLETLEVGFRVRRDTGDLFGQSRQSPIRFASRQPGFDTEPPVRPARRKGCSH